MATLSNYFKDIPNRYANVETQPGQFQQPGQFPMAQQAQQQFQGGQGRFPQSQQGHQAGIFRGAPGEFLQAEKFSPQQQPYFNQASQMGMQGLQNPLAGFEPISQMATRNWEKNILPALKSQFADVDAQESSGFQEALGQSGADLATQLGALGSQYGLQQQGLSQNLLGMGLTPQYETTFQDRQPSLIETLLGMLLQGGGQVAGQAAKSYFGGK